MRVVLLVVSDCKEPRVHRVLTENPATKDSKAPRAHLVELVNWENPDLRELKENGVSVEVTEARVLVVYREREVYLELGEPRVLLEPRAPRVRTGRRGPVVREEKTAPLVRQVDQVPLERQEKLDRQVLPAQMETADHLVKRVPVELTAGQERWDLRDRQGL